MDKEIQDLLQENGVSENFAPQLKLLIEKAVNEVTAAKDLEIVTIKAKAEEYSDYVAEQLTQRAEEYAEYVAEQLSERATAYVDTVTADFLKENATAIAANDEHDKYKQCIGVITEAMAKVGVIINPNAEVEAIQESVTQAKSIASNYFDQLQVAKKEIDELKCKLVFESGTAQLSELQKCKANELLGKVSFDSPESYKDALTLVVESVSQGEVKEVKEEPKVTAKPTKASAYLAALK